MASINKHIDLDAPAAAVWDALRDVGAIHRRLAPGFVTNVELEPGARVVTFGNGMVVRELIIDVDDAARRLAWAARSERLEHYSASAQVFPLSDTRCRFVWIADLLPNSAAAGIAAMIDEGLKAVARQFTTARALETAS